MFWDIAILAAIGIYAAIMILGCIVWKSNTQKTSHRFFFIFTSLFSVWLAANFLSIWALKESTASLFLYIDFMLAPFWALYLLLFLNTFPVQRIRINYVLSALLYLATVFASLLVPLGYVITDIEKVGYKIYFSDGTLFVVYALIVGVGIFGGIILSLINFIKQRGFKRVQARIILFGFAIFFSVLFIGNIFFQTLIPAEFFILINLSSVILPVAITVAILKHRFMGLKSIYRTYSVFFVLFIFTTLYIQSISIFASLTETAFGVNQMVVYAFLSAIFVPLFIFVHEQMKALAELIFSSKVDPKVIFNEILSSLNKDDSAQERITKLLEKIELVLGTEPTLIVFDQNKTCTTHGKALPFLQPGEVEGICQKAYMIERTIVRDELKYISLMPGGEQDRLYQTLVKQQLEIIVPIKEETKDTQVLRGAVVMHKKNGSSYSQEEITFLEMLAPQLAKHL